MISLLRKLLVVVAVAALSGPTAATWCASAAERSCAMVAAAHACCDGPRLNNCRCDGRDASRRESEPAQPFARVNADSTAVTLAFEAPASAAVPAFRVTWLDASPPPAATRDRLSLLSTLLV